MNSLKARVGFLAICTLGLGAGVGNADEVTPFNSWRALIVYTNSIDSLYGDFGSINLHKTYWESLFDGLNQTYENSGINTRAQIAGVIHDKTYAQDYSGTTTQVLYAYRGDITSGNYGMSRYSALLDRYSADALILVHHDTSGGGISAFPIEISSWGYVPIYVSSPTNLYLWAHEMGHAYGLHHGMGHRLTFDAYGGPMGGPLPDSMPFVLGVRSNGSEYMLSQDTVVTEYGHQQMGFHTTMSYTSYGQGTANARAISISNTYGGITRTFMFCHGGLWHATEWTGRFGGPSIYWTHPIAGTHATGGDSIVYLNRLRYVGTSSDSMSYTSTYQRNEVASHQANDGYVRDLKGVPDSLTVTSDMNLGPNAADSQWVYAHLVAAENVRIEPGFHVAGSASMKISVGSSGMTSKRAAKRKPIASFASAKFQADGFHVKFRPVMNFVEFSLDVESSSPIVAALYDVGGRHKRTEKFHPIAEGGFRGKMSMDNLPGGVYVMRISTGNQRFQKQFMKW